MENKEPIKYEIPANAMEQVFKLLAGGPYYIVGDAINLLRASAKPIYPQEIGEKEQESKEKAS